jgi:hypothetical protein
MAVVQKAPRRWQEWVIAMSLIALAVVGFLTVFDDEIARWQGGNEAAAQPPAGATPAPPVAGNTQGTL